MTKNKVKAIIIGVVALLIIALCVGLIFNFTRDKGDSTMTPVSDGGAQLTVTETKGVSMLIAPLSVTELEDDEDADEVESAFKLTVTVNPSNTKDTTVKWSIEFVNPESSWAQDKLLADYVAITYKTANTATVVCRGAFGEQIKVTATSNQDSTKKAECTVDYKQKITYLTVKLGDVTCTPMDGGLSYSDGRRISEVRVFPDFEKTSNSTYSVTVTKSDVYTIKAAEPEFYFTFCATEAFKTGLNSSGFNAEALQDISFDYGTPQGTIENFFNKGWFSAVLDGNVTAERVNNLINTLISASRMPSFVFTAYEKKNGEVICAYPVTIDTGKIEGQYQVDNVQMNDSNIIF